MFRRNRLDLRLNRSNGPVRVDLETTADAMGETSEQVKDRDRPLSRRLDRCNRVIQNESRYPFGGNVYYVTMQITSLTRKFRNGERNLLCDVVHITTKWVSSLTLDCNGVFAIKACEGQPRQECVLNEQSVPRSSNRDRKPPTRFIQEL